MNIGNPEYLHFNDVNIQLNCNNKVYSISQIYEGQTTNTENEGAFLESLDITMPPLGGANIGINPDSIATKGSVSLIDHDDILFKALIGDLKAYLNNEIDDFLIEITITISCWSDRNKVFKGYVTNWNLSFTGSVPTINLEWSVVNPNPIPFKSDKQKEFIQTNKVYNTPKEAFEDLSKAFNYKVYVKDKNGVIDKSMSKLSDLSFSGSPYTVNLKEIPNSTNMIYSQFSRITSASKQSDGAIPYGYIDCDNNETIFVVHLVNSNISKGALSSVDDNNFLDKIIFVVNGSGDQSILIDGKVPVSVEDFSFKTSPSESLFQLKVFNSENGNISVGNHSAEQSSINSNSLATSKESQLTTATAISISFKCYNIMSFPVNCVDYPLSLKVYNERGEEHPISRESNYMVTEVSYSLNGGVISANVSATSTFNQLRDYKISSDGSVDLSVKPKT